MHLIFSYTDLNSVISVRIIRECQRKQVKIFVLRDTGRKGVNYWKLYNITFHVRGDFERSTDIFSSVTFSVNFAS